MAKHLILSDRHSRWRIAVSGPTQLGRLDGGSSNQWAVEEREQPSFFDGLEAYVTLDRDEVSRNHAAIFEGDGRYHIVDLNSMNGTFLNGENINPQRSDPQPRELQDGDCLRFPGSLELEVKYRELTNAALLIGAGSDYAGAAEHDVSAIRNELLRRGYEVHTLLGGEATKQGVRDKIDEIAGLATSDAQFFFYCHGHGSNAGIKLGQQYMNPRELYQRLRQMRGKSAVIIEACNAGIFVDESNQAKIPEGTLVLAASGVDQQAGETQQPNGMYSGRFTASLVAYLQEHPEAFSLKNFYESVQNSREELGDLVLQGPAMVGQTYVMPRQTAVLNLSSR